MKQFKKIIQLLTISLLAVTIITSPIISNPTLTKQDTVINIAPFSNMPDQETIVDL